MAALWVGAPPRLEIDRAVRPDRIRRGASSDVIIDVHAVSGRTRVLEAEDTLVGPHGARRMAVPPIRVRGGTPGRISYRERPAGDTVVLITSAGGVGGSETDAAAVAALRATYKCVVVGVLGAPDGEYDTLPAQPGVVVLAATDAAGFARRWDRVRRWG